MCRRRTSSSGVRINGIVRAARTLSMRVGRWYFIEVKHVSFVRDDKAQTFQLAELIIEGRTRHSDFFLYGGGRKGEFVSTLIRGKIDV